ncbi:hypothetical protein EW145_g1835 [Phellinidium pouzarii]|uniref:Uncharacterized protein n=1 Tax=Phellinidium pouzarii TaxID=167371 RepID=A0A4S4LDH9_9AGAM|nr:hypothetical protein EW145_g1835 [Phellinidium pouzarii]
MFPTLLSSPTKPPLSAARVLLHLISAAMLYKLSQWGSSEWAAIQSKRDSEVAADKDHIKSLQYQLNISRHQHVDLKSLFNNLQAENSLLKADITQAREAQKILLQKHIRTHSLSYNLTSKVSLMSSILVSERAYAAKQMTRLRFALGVILWFVKFARISAKRVRSLSACNTTLQARFSDLLASDLALRQRYINLEGLCLTARQSVDTLSSRLEHETSLQKSLEKEKTKLVDTLHASDKDVEFYQALSWTVVARYDNLHSEYGQLLVNFEQLKSECCGFRKELQEIVAQVQETLELAEIGLNDLHRTVNSRPMKTKQDLMKVGQGLDLVRLNITELLVSMVVVDAHNAAVSSPIPCPSFSPGTIEDVVRKLKTLYEAEISEDSCRFVEADLSADELQEVTLADIAVDDQKENKTRHAVKSVHEILSRIESSGVRRETFLADVPSKSDIIDKLQQIVDEESILSKMHNASDLLEGKLDVKAQFVEHARNIVNLDERQPKIISL